MTGRRPVCMTLIISAALLGYGLAQAEQDSLSDDDIFSTEAFDQALSESKVADSANRLEYLPGVFFVAEGSAYRAHDAAATSSDARFFGKAFVKASKADIGALYLGYNFN
jgi:hypothetical protein